MIVFVYIRRDKISIIYDLEPFEPKFSYNFSVGVWPGIFFKLARCGYTLRVTSQTSYSPEYITPTQKKL
jgi:hypothetical protein